MKGTEELIKDLKTKDSSVKEYVIGKLASIGDEKAVDALVPLLNDKNRFVRQEVISALGKIGDRKIIKALTQAQDREKDEYVKDSINKVLARLK